MMKDWLGERGIPFTPEVYEGYGEDGPMDEATIVALSALMTNVDRPVYALTDAMPAEVSVAAFARYSRSPRPMRTLLVREFWGLDGLDLEKARGLSGKIVMEYGDDSVKQLGMVRVACEMVSQMAVKEIEDGRVGVGYLEKSSRYVDFGKPVDGKFLYLRPKEIKETGMLGEYEGVMDEAFRLYRSVATELRKYLVAKFPRQEGVDEAVYKASIRAKAFDIARVFLPMATLTNVGMIMSGQAMENMLNKMATSPLDESRVLADEIRNEASQVMPSLIPGAAEDRYGGRAREYLLESRRQTREVTRKFLGRMSEREPSEPGQQVELVERDEAALDKVVAAIIFPHSHAGLSEVNELIGSMTKFEKKELVDAYLAGRTDRRHKPGRAFEEASYTFQITAKVAEWRDLQRMRMMNQQRQEITMDHGFNTPVEFDEVEIDGEKAADLYQAHMDKRRDLFEKVRGGVSPEVAQHVAGFGNYMMWTITANLRQLYHMIPLRAGAAGHPDYRRIAREMFYQMAEVDPILTLPMEQFIDFSDEPRLERLTQLARVKEKLDKLGATPGDTFEDQV
ncbi:FAD-dependent thymidylate synthase [Candidatus Amesbacteria bacterium]|nr:FAD-dependent thymidylate synthase [Candidatus Amesbacteria bacterium]